LILLVYSIFPRRDTVVAIKAADLPDGMLKGIIPKKLSKNIWQRSGGKNFTFHCAVPIPFPLQDGVIEISLAGPGRLAFAGVSAARLSALLVW
jgi:hypothetical protein